MLVRHIKKAATVLGIFLELVAAILLLAWFQAGDPDCILSTGVFAQLRMCDPEIVGEAQSPPYIYLLAIIAIFLVGALVQRYGVKSDKRDD
ncbi:MAG: hypothetical protein LBE62_05285 [Azonexus sp.]|nr:hypothetical protein [Azonexus sp.]